MNVFNRSKLFGLRVTVTDAKLMIRLSRTFEKRECDFDIGVSHSSWKASVINFFKKEKKINRTLAENKSILGKIF